MTETSELLPLFAVTAPGLEPLATAELAALGIRGVAEAGGVAWSGTVSDLHSANLHLRTASRVLLRVGEFRARAFYELEKRARRLPWERFVAPGREVELRVTCRKSKLYHQGAVAQRVLEAIEHRAGTVRMAAGAAEDEDDEQSGAGAQLFVVRFVHDRCTISVDTSGSLLHLRGYRQALAKAPLRETLASALLVASGWDGSAPLVDPMCGSGTVTIEAALMARRIAPGLATASREPRGYAFEQWPGADAAGWQATVDRAREAILPVAAGAIHASDRDAGAIEAARSNAERAGVADDVALEVRPLSAIDPPSGRGWLITNPPYGVRVGESDALRNLYAALGRVARDRLPDWTVALLSANADLERHVGLRFTETLRTRNGGIPVRAVVAAIGG